MCKCKPGMNDVERYALQIVVEFPIHKIEKEVYDRYKVRKTVCIDPCIIDEIQMLWDKGILTMGCCCGHNNPKWHPFVNVADEHIDQMLAMGYVQQHYDPTRKDTFRLKSA